MNEIAEKYTALFRQMKSAAAATVDAQGRPQVRMIHIMLAEDDGMYIVTSKGKPFYAQLVETGEIALAALCPSGCQSLKFTGRLRRVGREWVDRVFAQNPELSQAYPGENRYILTAFHIYEGHGEWLDLSCKPIRRERFAYGGDAVEESGFAISNRCIGCSKCLKTCLQRCITPGTPYAIDPAHCIQCGRCAEFCPVGAIQRRHP